jgi:site-specific DNA-methyltransferase (adenine-specific)
MKIRTVKPPPQPRIVKLGNRATLYNLSFQETCDRYIEDSSIDAVIADPPYGIEFMGKGWDTFTTKGVEKDRKSAGGYGKDSTTNENGYAAAQIRYANKSIAQSLAYQDWCEEWASYMFRILKPGGFFLAFGGTRTYHRLACGIENAGFEIRDMLGWCYLSGFPKSSNLSKTLDRMNGTKGKIIGEKKLWGHNAGSGAGSFSKNKYEGQTGITRSEPILAPSSNDAKQWDGWGTALKPAIEPICMARKPFKGSVAKNVQECGTGAINIGASRVGEQGRWPANLIFDEEAGLFMDTTFQNGMSRIFYCPKPSKKERDLGLDILEEQLIDPFMQTGNGKSGQESSISEGRNTSRKNIHPTVKPVALLQYLSTLVTPPRGTIYDSVCGSGSGGVAALLSGFSWVGSERDTEHGYFPIAEARLQHIYNSLLVRKSGIKLRKVK